MKFKSMYDRLDPQGIPWHHLDLDVIRILLATNWPKGLSECEAAARLRMIGFNNVGLTGMLPVSIAAAIFSLGVVSLLLRVGPQSALESATLLLFLILFLIKFGRKRVLVIRDGRTSAISAKKLVPGDLIQPKSGRYVPADCRLIEAKSLTCDEGTITGLSGQITYKCHIPTLALITPISARRNMLYAGTTIQTGYGLAVVVATGARTVCGRSRRGFR